MKQLIFGLLLVTACSKHSTNSTTIGDADSYVGKYTFEIYYQYQYMYTIPNGTPPYMEYTKDTFLTYRTTGAISKIQSDSVMIQWGNDSVYMYQNSAKVTATKAYVNYSQFEFDMDASSLSSLYKKYITKDSLLFALKEMGRDNAYYRIRGQRMK